MKPLNEKLLYNLALCRNVLAGKNDVGEKIFPGMFDKEVISFSHGEGIRRPHPSVVLAGIKALIDTKQSSLDNYLFLQRFAELDDRIYNLFLKIGVQPYIANNLCIDGGLTRIIQSFLAACSERGDIFLTSPSFYHPLPVWCEHFGVKLEIVQTQNRNDYKLTVEDLELWKSKNLDLLKHHRLRGIFLFNPNMTGSIYCKDELGNLIRFIVSNDIYVFEDSIFMGSEYEKRPTSHLTSFEELETRVVLASGASKNLNLANLRIGWACGPRNIIQKMNDFSISTSASIPQVSKFMASAALAAPTSYYQENINECVRRLKLINTCIVRINQYLLLQFPSIKEHLIKVEYQPKAGHSILLNLEHIKDLTTPSGRFIKNSIDITRFLLEEAHVSVAPCLSHGFEGCKVRLSYACTGLQYTYEQSRKWENEYLNVYSNSVHSGSIMDNFYIVNEGWRQGQLLIEKALIENFCPAIERLMEFNKKVYIENKYLKSYAK